MTLVSNVYLIWPYIIVICGEPLFGYLTGIDKDWPFQAFKDVLAFSMTLVSNVYLIWPYVIVICGEPLFGYLKGIDKD